MNDLITWMFNGNIVKNKEGDKLILKMLYFVSEGSNPDYTAEMTVSQALDSLEIYKTEQQLYVEALEEKVRTYEAAMKKKESRKSRKRLGPGEILDIENAMRKGAKKSWIISTYDISTTTYHRIKTGTHKLSTFKNQEIK
jgi:hypothetical protein